MAGKPSDRSRLPNAVETWQPFDRFVKTLQAAAQAAVDANKPNTVLTRNVMPHDHVYLEDMETRLKVCREKYEAAAKYLKDMEDAFKRHKRHREEVF